MPNIDDVDYPDTIKGIFADRALRKIFTNFMAKSSDAPVKCVRFAIERPSLIGQSELDLLQANGRILGVTDEHRAKMAELIATDADTKEIHAWPDLGKVINAARKAWPPEHAAATIKLFYKSKEFRKGTGTPSTPDEIFRAMNITVDAKVLKKLGYTASSNKLLMRAVEDYARASISAKTAAMKKAYEKAEKIEKMFDSMKRLHAELKRHKVVSWN